MSFFLCVVYLSVLGILSFFVGRLLPKRWFHADAFPFRAFAWEQDGRIYKKLFVHKWQNKVPDMSRILPHMMPPKNLSGNYRCRLPRMLQETCVAECIHVLNCIVGLYCLKILPGIGGVIITFLYIVLFNLPYILIQRYNRPRLQRLADRSSQAKNTEEGACLHARATTQLQYR